MNVIGCGCQLCYERYVKRQSKPRCETAPDPEEEFPEYAYVGEDAKRILRERRAEREAHKVKAEDTPS